MFVFSEMPQAWIVFMVGKYNIDHKAFKMTWIEFIELHSLDSPTNKLVNLQFVVSYLKIYL